MKTAAIALLALVALACVAQSEAQMRFCRVSAYQLPCDLVIRNKNMLYRACGLSPTRLSALKVGTCCTLLQQVPSKEVWDKYSKCEKEPRNKKSYGPLKAASAACASNQRSIAKC